MKMWGGDGGGLSGFFGLRHRSLIFSEGCALFGVVLFKFCFVLFCFVLLCSALFCFVCSMGGRGLPLFP